MFESTRSYILGQHDRQTVSLMMQETVQYMRFLFERLVQGTGLLTKESILQDLGPDLVAEVKTYWAQVTPEENLALTIKLFVEHPDLVAQATKELLDLANQHGTALATRLGISDDDPFEVVAGKLQVMQDTFEAVRIEIGTPAFNSQAAIGQLRTEHPDALERFFGEMDALVGAEAILAN